MFFCVLYLFQRSEKLETDETLLVFLHMFEQEAILCQVAVREELLQMGFDLQTQHLTFTVIFTLEAQLIKSVTNDS